jgi:hypothetical protein
MIMKDKMSKYAQLMREIARTHHYTPSPRGGTRCYERDWVERYAMPFPNLADCMDLSMATCHSVYGGRSSFESVFTWAVIALERENRNGSALHKATKVYNEGMLLVGHEWLYDYDLAMITAFERHVPIQTGKFNSIFRGLKGWDPGEYDQAEEFCQMFLKGDERLRARGEVPEWGTPDRATMASAVVQLYTNTTGQDRLEDRDLVEWKDWAERYLEARGEDRKDMRLSKFDRYGWWNERLG